MLGRSTKILSFSLSPEMADEIEELAKKERRSKSELLREMVHVYKERQAEAEWQDLFAFGEKTAKRFGIKNEDELFKILNGTT
ncbi:MAG: ribbon-helix-helix domain-containing protein [Actinomycetota bacterium]|nr:ribbon-helix-helix domain-containing protein [Actinomycetota bacterium]